MVIKAAELIANPLYQVNLTLWMLRPSAGMSVKPILYQAGYRLRDIERELTLPVELSQRLLDSGIEASNPVAPDLLLDSPGGDTVLLECKCSMFGAAPNGGDSQVRQATALLLQSPLVLSSGLALNVSDIRSTHLIYLTCHDGQVPQTEGLAEIARNLRSLRYLTASFGLMGLDVAQRSIRIRCQYPDCQVPQEIARQIPDDGVEVQRLTANTDPRPLYYIPWMPGSAECEDDYSEANFGNRIFMAAVTKIGPEKPPCLIELDVDDLLRAATFNHYDRWRHKSVRKRLRSRTKELLFREIKRADNNVSPKPLGNPSRGWALNIPDVRTQNRIIEGLRKWQTEHWNQPVQPSLFDELDEADD